MPGYGGVIPVAVTNGVIAGGQSLHGWSLRCTVGTGLINFRVASATGQIVAVADIATGASVTTNVNPDDGVSFRGAGIYCEIVTGTIVGSVFVS